jgi:hypothetical protein
MQEIDAVDRHALEHVIGRPLEENQIVIIQVETKREKPTPAMSETARPDVAKLLPAWCNVYEGLSDQEMEEIEAVILDRDHWTRDSA